MLLIRGLLLDPATLSEIAWTLIHFVWQALIFAALLWLALRFLLRPATARYVACCMTLFLMLLSPAVTYWTLRGKFDAPAAVLLPPDLVSRPKPTTRPGERLQRPIVVAARSNGTSDQTGTEVDQPITAAVNAATGRISVAPVARSETASKWSFRLPAAWAIRFQRALPVIVLGWLVVASLLAVRQGIALILLRRFLRTRTRALRDEHGYLALLPRRLDIRRPVHFAECDVIASPATVGSFRPLVLLPTAALADLSREQLEALVLHELAHIRRHDYLLNLAQTVLESVMAYHPAVWWVSSNAREEREHCCDELAARVIGSRKLYATALSRMEQLRARPLREKSMLNAAGGRLLERIRRLASASRFDTQSRLVRAAHVALLGPFVSACILFIVAAQIVASSVEVDVPRGLHDVSALSSAVYHALNVPADGNGDVLAALERAVDTASPDAKSFDSEAVADLVKATFKDPRADAMVQVQLPLTGVEQRISHQSAPCWRFSTLHVRTRLRRCILDQAMQYSLNDNAAQAKAYARAALLLAAQESGLYNAAAINQVLKYDKFTMLAQLSSRESARINRAISDSRLIVSVCNQEMLRAIYCLRVLVGHKDDPTTASDEDVRAARDDLADALTTMLRVSYKRPDIEWTVAHLCWQARGVLSGADLETWRDQLLTWSNADDRSPHRQQWVEQALAAAVPANPLGPGRTAEQISKQVREWEKRGVLGAAATRRTSPTTEPVASGRRW